MSNCVVGSGGSRLPRGIIAEHGVEGSDHFSHDGDDDDLGFLVGVGKTVGEGLESGIVILSWDHRPRRCPPLKTGVRPHSPHPGRHPSSTGPCHSPRSGG